MKLQLSLEFLIVFSFVLLVFIFMFALISSERSLGLSDQTFAQLQLQAQGIASAMDSALQAGNGYIGSLAVTNLIGLIPYNVTITKNGMVILQAKVGKQIIKAIAYSMAKNVVSNPSYLVSGTSNQYLIPIANGTIYLQNSFGKVCIDYQCATQSNQAEHIALSTESVYAAQFNGQSSYIYGSLTSYFGNNNPLTAVAWAYISPSGNGPIFGVTSCPPGGCWNMPFLSEEGLTVFGWIWGVNSNNPISYNVPRSGWYMLAITYNPSGSGTEDFYVNGQLVGSASGQYSPSGTTDYWTTYISGSKPGGVNNYYNSLIANVQAFATNLSSSQIQALYQEGIDGAPIDLQHLVAWWPLNGNANDYSGNGNNGVIHGPILFTGVSQFFAKVLNGNGKPLSNTLVNFASSYGPMVPQSNFTNQNGVATSFLNFNNVPGKALVKATAYNGNYTVANSIIAWWPLNLEFELYAIPPTPRFRGHHAIMLFATV